MNRWFAPAFLLIIALALALRAPRLGLRPLHNDEAVNAMRFRDLWVSNTYKYDPDEFHGPTLEYFTLPAALLSGSRDFNAFSEKTFRAVTVAFGVALILLLLPLARDLGKPQTLWAALLMAISPAMVFYSRYYIHEMLLVFFTAIALLAAWRYWKTNSVQWCVLGGASIGLMYATKETFVFAVFSAIAAAICSLVLGRLVPAGAKAPTQAQADGSEFKEGQPENRQTALDFKFRLTHLLIALAVGGGIAALFFTSFFANRAGFLDAFKTYLPWLRRAGGASPHVHSWSFYFERLLWFHTKGGPIWTEALIVVLALVGAGISLAGRGLRETSQFLARFITSYTLFLTFIYTFLAYKTPWCLLGFYWGMILLAGIGAGAVVNLFHAKTAGFVSLCLLAAAAQLSCQSWRASFGVDSTGAYYCVSKSNPYVYSQTTMDLLKLVDEVKAIAHVAPQTFDTDVEVMSDQSPWPLPWYLREFKHVGFWDHIPAQPPAPIMIVSTGLHAAFDDAPNRTHLMAGYFQLRPGVFVELYVAINLWTDYVKTLPKERDD